MTSWVERQRHELADPELFRREHKRVVRLVPEALA